MAKLKSIFNIEGTLGEMTFFKKRDGSYFIKQKSSISRERVLNDPRFARTRENGAEFGTVAQSAKLVRKGATMFIGSAKDPSLTRRLVALFAKVKRMDSISDRGKRNVYEGLLTVEGKALLRGFEFNGKADLSTIMRYPFSLDANTGDVTFDGLFPRTMVKFPESATHVSFSSGAMRVDFELGETDMEYSKVKNLKLDMKEVSFVLQPHKMPKGEGFIFFFLLIKFFQEVNGIQYPLNSEPYDVLTLLEVVDSDLV